MNWISLMTFRFSLAPSEGRKASPVMLLAIIAIAFGMLAILVSVSVTSGFEKL